MAVMINDQTPTFEHWTHSSPDAQTPRTVELTKCELHIEHRKAAHEQHYNVRNKKCS
jgi:hypothetical protein